MSKLADTPLMEQFKVMKKRHPDAILLFRVGDFYEMFAQDAIDASNILGITLTKRAVDKAESVELAGFPHHALDSYLPKLVRTGRRVAICEQLEDPKLTKKLVERGITKTVIPPATAKHPSSKPEPKPKMEEVKTSNGYKVGDMVLYDRDGSGQWEKQKIVDFDKNGRPILDTFNTNWITELADWQYIKPLSATESKDNESSMQSANEIEPLNIPTL